MYDLCTAKKDNQHAIETFHGGYEDFVMYLTWAAKHTDNTLDEVMDSICTPDLSGREVMAAYFTVKNRYKGSSVDSDVIAGRRHRR